jgi:hypothetical protein
LVILSSLSFPFYYLIYHLYQVRIRPWVPPNALSVQPDRSVEARACLHLQDNVTLVNIQPLLQQLV